MIKNKKLKLAYEYAVVCLLALASATCFHVFILHNEFAPAGINGLCAMIQYKFGLSIGYLGFIINIPLAIVNFIWVNKPFAIRTMLFICVFSSFILVLEHLGVYYYDEGEKCILASIVSGVISGIIYGLALKFNACTGGTDLIASIIQHKNKEFNFVWVGFALNCAVAVLSFFVYENGMEPVILCIIHCYFNSKLSDELLKGVKSGLKVEIITDKPDEVKEALYSALKHGITKITVTGMYSGTEKSMLVCVIQKRQLAILEKVISGFDGAFVYVCAVNQIFGQFRGKEEIRF